MINQREEWASLNVLTTSRVRLCFSISANNGCRAKVWKPWTDRLILARGTVGGDCWLKDLIESQIISAIIIFPTTRISLRPMDSKFISTSLLSAEVFKVP